MNHFELELPSSNTRVQHLWIGILGMILNGILMRVKGLND